MYRTILMQTYAMTSRALYTVYDHVSGHVKSDPCHMIWVLFTRDITRDLITEANEMWAGGYVGWRVGTTMKSALVFHIKRKHSNSFPEPLLPNF